ncbi:DUF6119 family protein [Streptomyces sp. B22F1]|uniref:DUF6119 family protein n=1 Tax=Streptomyces sp. B22F1 TaxID=3153566 RepID=UPI00325F8246
MGRKSSEDVQRSTIYKLLDTGNSITALHEALTERYLEDSNFILQDASIGGNPSLLLTGEIHRKARADWCSTVERLTGKSINVANKQAAGAILIGMDEGPFALTYGMGYLLIDAARIDPGFGLSFAIRAMDPNFVRQITRNILDSRARIDRSSVAGGQSIRGFGIEAYGEIVSRLSGKLGSVSMTFNKSSGRKISIAAADSLKIHLGAHSDSLVDDLRTVSAISTSATPVPELGFIERVRALKSQNKFVASLEDHLSSALGAEDESLLATTLPAECEEQEHAANSFRLKIASETYEVVEEVTIDDVRARLEPIDPADRQSVLKAGYIQMCSDHNGKEPVSRQVKAHKWLAFEVALDNVHFFYHQGRWFEVGSDYHTFLNERLEELFSRPPSLTLPIWTGKQEDEEAYNKYAAKGIPGSVCLDQKRVHTGQHPHGIEMCDIIGPNSEFIHVKRSSSSAPLSHLFAQGWTSIESLRSDSEARLKLRKRIDEVDRTHSFDPAAKPRKLVYAIAIKRDATVSPKNLFTFSRVSLLRAVNALANADVDVEVIGIQQQ